MTRSLDLMRKRGYIAGIVERRLPHANTTVDLFGFLDILCIHITRPNDVVGVQTTSAAHVADHLRKIRECQLRIGGDETVSALAVVRQSGIRLLVHGWYKMKSGRWMVREEDIS